MKSRLIVIALAAAAALASTNAIAGETVTYEYDVHGRLVKVVHSGTVNNGEQVDYTHDKADNRTEKKTTGA